ncbi:aminotransferase class III-fold pyridoxal phosphate-dependent enzyme [Francisella sp. XLW-1]|uniref:aminotransferase class III-fold pyridoxal phosphate-dependent enzyme n=1 Tax=Francisella sp. XLW-1 TaxID=2610887 RepID=UPI00123D07EA|nr:aminotransferase class III-fold pyridoxal phosphate-dependent enzyme [Francisella sp. XLW-1]
MSIREQIKQNNIDHNVFTWVKQGGLNPACIERGEGSFIYDYDGKKILDFTAGLISVNLGHGNLAVINAVTEQMKAIAFPAPVHATKVKGELAKKLAELLPGDLNKAYFTLCGASANEAAIKAARAYSGKQKILTRYRSFHGGSYATMTLGGDPRKLPHDADGIPGVVHFEIPSTYDGIYNENPKKQTEEALKHLERVINYEAAENVAAIMLEGVSGTSGCYLYPEGYMEGVRELCDKYGILLIVDEVMSGFCRTGKWFGFMNYDIVPDIVTMAKGITSSYLPLGCCMLSDKIMAKFQETAFVLGATYSGHPVSCAAGLATINEYERLNVLDNVNKMSAYFGEKVEELKAKHKCIGDYRSKGLLGCFELVKNRETKEPLVPYNAKDVSITTKIAGKFKELGLHSFVRWNHIFVGPPLTISKEELDIAVTVLDEVFTLADTFCD